jgi:hypothetical protein
MDQENQAEPTTPPLGNLAPNTLFSFVLQDFEAAWDSMARCNPEPAVGGNFLFARQAMSALELASRVAQADSTGITLGHFSERLRDADERYFVELPGPVPLPHEFRLPAVPRETEDRQLLAAIFDLLRNGLAHLSQQIPVTLRGGKLFGLSVAGVSPGVTVNRAKFDLDRRQSHLVSSLAPNGQTYLLLRPELMFFDFVWAAHAASVFSKGLVPEYLERPRHRHHYDFTANELRQALSDGGIAPRELPRRPASPPSSK